MTDKSVTLTARFEKLIRDGIPALARRDGQTLSVRTATNHELFLLFARKLVEESAEVYDALQAGERGALLAELADLQTVINDLGSRNDINRAEIDVAAGAKRQERGGFDGGLVLATSDLRVARLHPGNGATLLDALRSELSPCRAASLAVSLVLGSGLDAIEGALRAALLRRGRIRILTT